MFVLKTSAGFDLFKWIALAAADFLEQGGKAGTFFWAASFQSYFAIGGQSNPSPSLDYG